MPTEIKQDRLGQLLTPVVQSTAKPRAEILLQLRSIIQNSKESQDLFLQLRTGKTVEWLRDMVATRLAAHIRGEYTFDDVLQACHYLADEYNQLGEGYFIVSTETGLVVSVVTDDDLYDPGVQARHSGDTGQALKRLKPHTETMLVTYHHERSRESTILETLANRAHQTALLREDGDHRLRMATRGGRKEIASDLAGDDPRELLRRSGGTSGMFLRHFPVQDDESAPPSAILLEGTAVFRSTIKVQDSLAMNISYNRLGNLRSAAAQGWVRDIARRLSDQAYQERRPFPTDAEELIAQDLEGPELWVADPDTFKYFLNILPTARAVPIEGISPIGLTGQLGFITVADSFRVESHELFQRWEVVASLEYKLYVFNWESVRVLPVVGIPRAATVVDH